MTTNVSLDIPAVLYFMACAAAQRIAANINRGTYFNHDAIFAPSQWNYYAGGSVRHTLDTSMTASAAADTVRLELNHTIRTI